MKKTISFAILHFSVAFTVAYLLTGERLTASLIALVLRLQTQPPFARPQP